MFIYSPKISDDLFSFFSHRPSPGFNMYFSVGGAKSVADINRGTKTLTFPHIHSRCHYSFCQLRRGTWPDWPPWIRTSRGAEGGPLWTPRFSSSRGAVQRSRGAAAYPGSMVIRALIQRVRIFERNSR